LRIICKVFIIEYIIDILLYGINKISIISTIINLFNFLTVTKTFNTFPNNFLYIITMFNSILNISY